MGDAKTYDLFDESDLGPVTKAVAVPLVIRSENSDSLSGRQRAFNRLSKRISSLERRLSRERDKCERLLALHHGRVRPVEVKLAGCYVDLAKALAGACDRLGFAKGQHRTIRAAIVELCGLAFELARPDPETEAFYDSWSGSTYQDEITAEARAFKEEIAEGPRAGFGIDIDFPKDEDDTSPEAMARLMNELREKLRSGPTEQRGKRGSRKKSGQQLEREARMKAEKELAAKTVRSVYLALAKILHPDAVADPRERAHREEFMKRATTAYKQGDLYTLLALETQWMSHDGDRLSTLSDDTLDIYVQTLKDQVSQLEVALEAQYYDPRYADLHGLTALSDRAADECIRQRIADLRAEADDLVTEVAVVSHATRKRAVMERVKVYLAQARLDDELGGLADLLRHDFRATR